MKTMTLLFILLSCVGYSHTDEEKGRYVNGILEGALYVASDDNWSVEGRDPDPDNVLSTWEGFLGRPGGDSLVGGWSLAERRAAFDWYLGTLATTNCLVFSSMDKKKVLSAFASCKRLAHTNSVPLLRAAALNHQCVYRDLAIQVAVDFSGVGPQSTGFVETVFTNTVAFSPEEREAAAGPYADKVMKANPQGSVASSNVSAAVGMFYRNRMLDSVACYPIDDLLCEKMPGYAASSNRLETMRFILSLQGLDDEIRTDFTAVTNQLLSSGQPLRWINVGGASE